MPPHTKPPHLLPAPGAAFETWRDWVARFAALLTDAPADASPIAAAAARPGHCMIFSPHPDDECIVGALPLRLAREAGWRVTNVAVTLGSRPERREPRWRELEAACAVLGFDNMRPTEQGLAQVRTETELQSPQLWRAHRRCIAELLQEERPDLVLAPHAGDGNPTHKGVHKLLTQALSETGLPCLLAETEFWATMETPNCLVESGIDDTARLVQALACHLGEIERNPYHLRLPAWLADGVRRGGELMGGAGSQPPAYAFGTLYRLSRWEGGSPQDLAPQHFPATAPLSGREFLP
ncbi:PIG-L family deacetylase [Roseateles sp. DAIF2]|uniref:PIG-L deacetylase family protein n=1 Tax=Roseateles sp. DAIF2 TaxID=2714952 RepID=UPI0018A25EB8|nr:PIG-L family deacetylase [Roseateles sp. DAIF2]QPF74348.1 PIG-L family deacetylase [Roseateles sp. DAIF2]